MTRSRAMAAVRSRRPRPPRLVKIDHRPSGEFPFGLVFPDGRIRWYPAKREAMKGRAEAFGIAYVVRLVAL